VTDSTTPRPARRLRAPRLKGALAAVAVVGFFGTLVIAPFATPDAEADEAFYDRIHQEFTPELAADAVINVSVSPRVEIPRPVEKSPAAGTAGAMSQPQYTGGGSPAEWMAAAGIAKSDWGYVDYIVSRESGWNPNAYNPRGGYCGLVQIAPLHNVANCTDPVVNLRWATGYANGRYGGWEGAWRHWATYQNGW